MDHPEVRASVATALCLLLGACGGGGGGVNSFPGAPAAPAQTPAPAPVLPPPSIGLVSDAPFAALGFGHAFQEDNRVEIESADRSQRIEFRYDAATRSYEILLPGYERGNLKTVFLNGSEGQVATSTGNRVTRGASESLQSVLVTLSTPGSDPNLTYTSYGYWQDKIETEGVRTTQREGRFVYGIPTAAGDVPLSGTASYAASVTGFDRQGNFVGGTAELNIDFAAGTLSGVMRPVITIDWDHIPLAPYVFRDTIYARGGTSFSGRFDVPNLPAASSHFEGLFTGPQAAELMARWQAPYVLNGPSIDMFGTWVGKKK